MPDLVAPWLPAVHRARDRRLRAQRHPREPARPLRDRRRRSIAAAALAGLARCGAIAAGRRRRRSATSASTRRSPTRSRSRLALAEAGRGVGSGLVVVRSAAGDRCRSAPGDRPGRGTGTGSVASRAKAATLPAADLTRRSSPDGIDHDHPAPSRFTDSLAGHRPGRRRCSSPRSPVRRSPRGRSSAWTPTAHQPSTPSA